MNKPTPHKSEFLFYTSIDGSTKVEVILQDETVWLSLNRLASLFGTSKQNVSYHINNIFSESELDRDSTVKEVLTVQSGGNRDVTRNIAYYNLDVIISVGYRINL